MEIYTPEPDEPAREHNNLKTGLFLRRLGAAATLFAIGSSSFIAWDAWDTTRSEPLIGPKVVTVENPSEDQSTMSCRDAESVLVTGSSMGLQVSEYMGANATELANQHGMCVWAVKMGTYYDDAMPDQIAQDLVDKAREEMPGKEKVRMIFWGESWGANLLQRVANSEAIQGDDRVEVQALILESSPSGMESVKWLPARAMLEMNKRGFWLGKRALFLLGVGGMAYQYAGQSGAVEFFGVHINDAKVNNDKTSPRLVGHQGADIAANGFPRAANETDNSSPVVFVAWQGDETVDNGVAISEIESRLQAPMSVAWIAPDERRPIKHAECWKDDAFREYCAPVLKDILDEYAPRR